MFLDALKRLGEPARLPCCDFPADWSGAKKGGHPQADVRKCLWVADKVLLRRHTRTAYTFAATLALKVGGWAAASTRKCMLIHTIHA